MGILFLFFLFLLLESSADLLINQLDQLSNINASTGLKDVSTSSGTSLSCLSGGTESKSYFPQESTLRSDQKHDTTEGAKAVPLGLGLGGLERKVIELCISISILLNILLEVI